MDKDLSTLGIYVFSVFLGLVVLPELHADATIYKHVDENGNITFTNRSIKGGQKLQDVQQSPVSSTVTVNVAKHFSKESVYKQNKRDIKRREILEHELSTEIKLFADVRKHLALLRSSDVHDQQKEVIRQLQNKMLHHKSNIAALKQELAKL